MQKKKKRKRKKPTSIENDIKSCSFMFLNYTDHVIGIKGWE